MNLCDLEDTHTCWDEIVDVGVQNWRKKVIKYFVCKLVFGAAVYYIWRNRNDLRQGNTPLPEEQIWQKIKWEVRVRLMGKGSFRRTKGNEKICCNWGIDQKILA